MPGEGKPCVNDPRIADNEVLYRRVRHDQIQPFPESVSGYRPQSGVFRDPEMSVDRHILRSLEEVVRLSPGFHVAAITAQEVRALGLNVWWDPQDDNPAHSIVCPCMTVGQAKKIVNRANIFVHFDHNAFRPPNS